MPGLLGAGRRLGPRPVRTKAVRDGDHYVVNGQKTWTSFAQCADWIFCLVRTDSERKPQEGISFLLIDMKTPGITVRPIITLDGGARRQRGVLRQRGVPVANRIGEENKGWTCAKFLLANERSGIAGIGAVQAPDSSRGLPPRSPPTQRSDAGGSLRSGTPSSTARTSPAGARRTGPGGHRIARSRPESRGRSGAGGLLSKIRGTEIFQRLTELTHEAMGNYGLAIREHPVSGNHFMPGPDYGHTASESI